MRVVEGAADTVEVREEEVPVDETVERFVPGGLFEIPQRVTRRRQKFTPTATPHDRRRRMRTILFRTCRDVERDVCVLAGRDSNVATDRIGRRLAALVSHVRIAVAPNRQCSEPREGRAFEDHDIVGSPHRAVRILERARRPNPQLSITERSVERDRHIGVGGTRFSTARAYTTPAVSASRPYGAKIVPRTTSESAVPVNVGSHSIARSQARPLGPSARGAPFTVKRRRASGVRRHRQSLPRQRIPPPLARLGATSRARAATRLPGECMATRAMVAGSKPGDRGEWRSGHDVVMLWGRCHLGIITGHARAGDRRVAVVPSPRRPPPTLLLHDVRSRSTHRRILVCAALSLVAIVPRNVHGQRVLGVGEDATVLPGGVVRWSVQVGWSAYNEVYAPGGPLERLGGPFTSDSLGARQLEMLRPLRTTLRSLAQLPAAEVSLGPIRTDFTARVTRSAFVVDFGLTSRLMLTARLPYEHTISEVVVDVNPRNEMSHGANIGPIRR
jgi:hypothetical protein